MNRRGGDRTPTRSHGVAKQSLSSRVFHAMVHLLGLDFLAVIMHAAGLKWGHVHAGCRNGRAVQYNCYSKFKIGRTFKSDVFPDIGRSSARNEFLLEHTVPVQSRLHVDHAANLVWRPRACECRPAAARSAQIRDPDYGDHRHRASGTCAGRGHAAVAHERAVDDVPNGVESKARRWGGAAASGPRSPAASAIAVGARGTRSAWTIPGRHTLLSARDGRHPSDSRTVCEHARCTSHAWVRPR